MFIVFLIFYPAGIFLLESLPLLGNRNIKPFWYGE